ncbi:hypothetical protein F4814DRAFT_402411 [Daldinia grandis]|nr:hypothetical protein F4814DRAFT_402411 [Daldinia grandis]
MSHYKKTSSVNNVVKHEEDDAYIPHQGRRGGRTKSLKHSASEDQGPSKLVSKKTKYRNESDESDEDAPFYKPTQQELRDNGVLKFKPRAMDHLMVKVGKVTLSDDSDDDFKPKLKKNASGPKPERNPIFWPNASSGEEEQPKKKKGSKHSGRRAADSEDSDLELEEKVNKKGNKKGKRSMK